jgi:hypothetical protein
MDSRSASEMYATQRFITQRQWYSCVGPDQSAFCQKDAHGVHACHGHWSVLLLEYHDTIIYGISHIASTLAALASAIVAIIETTDYSDYLIKS